MMHPLVNLGQNEKLFKKVFDFASSDICDILKVESLHFQLQVNMRLKHIYDIDNM